VVIRERFLLFLVVLDFYKFGTNYFMSLAYVNKARVINLYVSSRLNKNCQML